MLENKYFKEVHYETYYIIFSLLPLILWSIIVYLFWWVDASKFRFGSHYMILIPIIWPYIYTFMTIYKDIADKNRLPLNPDWPICAKVHMPEKENSFLTWDWKCGSFQFKETISQMGSVGHAMYLMGYALLLLMIVTTALSKNTLDNRILRNFAAIIVSLGFLTFALMWLNTSGLYSLLVYKIMAILLSMSFSSLIIVIMALGGEINHTY